MPELSEEICVAIQAVLAACLEINRIAETDFAVSEKSKNDPVTEADLAANRIIDSILASHFPEDLLYSEEEIPDWEERSLYSRIWILDPLDGTREFVKRRPEYAISLGFVFQEAAVLGAILNPATGQLFWGELGGKVGSACLSKADLNKIANLDLVGPSHLVWPDIQEVLENASAVEKPKTLEDSSLLSIYISRTEQDSNLYSFLESDKRFSSEYQLVGLGSIAYKLGLLSAGLCDLVLSLKPKNEWDICAGVGILRAGGFSIIEIKSLSEYKFNQENPLTHGLIAGRRENLDRFLAQFRDTLQASLRDWGH
jgi:myo-inositol-1(or 4)-monophosphatase